MVNTTQCFFIGEYNTVRIYSTLKTILLSSLDIENNQNRYLSYKLYAYMVKTSKMHYRLQIVTFPAPISTPQRDTASGPFVP